MFSQVFTSEESTAQCSRMFTCGFDAEPDEKSSNSSLLHSAYTSSCGSALGGGGRKSSNSLTASTNTSVTSNSNHISCPHKTANGSPALANSNPSSNRNSSPTPNRNSNSSGECIGLQQSQQQSQQQQPPMYSSLTSSAALHGGDGAGGLAHNPHGGHISHNYMPQHLDATGPWALKGGPPAAGPPLSSPADYATDYAHSPHIHGALHTSTYSQTFD